GKRSLNRMFRVKVSVFLVAFCTSILITRVCENRSQVFFVVGFSVLETDSLAESQLCDVVIFK
ncbi:TPA: hypothetical protein ACMDTB_004782, partial [Vibrio parahaemolyticus]